MHDGITPQGQMELRLEAFQDTNLTHLNVEPCSTVTARYVFDDGSYYEFRVSPGTSSSPVFSWQAVTIGDCDIYTRSREHRGPSQTLPELLAEGESDGPLGNLWREDAMALIGIHEVAAAFIQERVDEAAAEAAYAASERLTTRFQQPAAAPPLPDVDECFEAFQAACQQRAPFCDSIQMDWGHDLIGVPGVAFGLAPGTPEQILYQADPSRSKQLYLNGFWTSEHSLEEDLLEEFPDDSWARLGARNAARDLLAIQDAGYRLMKTQEQASLQDIDQDKRERLLSSAKTGQPLSDDHFQWDKRAAEWLEGDLVDLFEKVKEYLDGLRREPKRKPTTRRRPKPGTPSALAAEV